MPVAHHTSLTQEPRGCAVRPTFIARLIVGFSSEGADVGRFVSWYIDDSFNYALPMLAFKR